MSSIYIRIGLIIVGGVLIVFGFWKQAVKKLTVNYAVIWALLGTVMVIVGAVPIFSKWTNLLAPETGFAFFCVGIVLLVTEVQNSLAISQLNMKNQELAMQVALLNQESEHLMAELKEMAREREDTYVQKDSVRD